MPAERFFFISIFNELQYCILFLSVCQPALSTKPQALCLVCFTTQTRYQSGSECGSVKHQQCHGSTKRFYLTVIDILLMNWRRLFNKSVLSRFLGLSSLMVSSITFYIDGKRSQRQNLSRVCLNVDSECNFVLAMCSEVRD